MSFGSMGQKKFSIVLPSEYDSDKTYPLFIVFHGGNGNMLNMMKWWTCKLLSEEFIVAYMEASTLDRAPDRWGWRNFPKERTNIKKYYEEITASYQVDEKQVYVGGFSLGGKMSIDLVMSKLLPVNGFVSLNHGGGISGFFTSSNIQDAANRGVRGFLIMGEKDYRYARESKDLNENFLNHGLQLKFVTNEGIGHSAPKDFENQLSEALEYIVH